MIEQKRVAKRLFVVLALIGSSTCAFGNPDNLQQHAAAMVTQNVQGCIDQVGKAIALDPKNGILFDKRATCYFILKQYTNAIADFDKAISLDSTDSYAFSNRASAYSRLGKTKEALADYSKSIELDPTTPDPWMERAEVYQQLGQNQAAITGIKKAIELVNASPAPAGNDLNRLDQLMMLSDCYNNLAALNFKDSKYGEAVDNFTRCIQISNEINSPSTFKTLNHLGYKQSPSPYAGRADAYDKLGKHDLAEADRKIAATQTNAGSAKP
jgi:tetratricopeptide (TPR) repeat protein